MEKEPILSEEKDEIRLTHKGECLYEMSMLLDFYSPLLTEPQRKTLELFYGDDYSLGEIAEEEGITRQAIRDRLLKGEKTLRDAESKLGLVARFGDTEKGLKEVVNGLEAIRTETGIDTSDLIRKAESLIR